MLAKKDRHWAYQPVVRHGIPKANSWEKDYQEFWKEQINRCLDGYKPPGYDKIPGRYYFYLNFLQVESAYGNTKRKVLDYPYYRDIDHEYFCKVEEAREKGKGLIVLKARRKGQTMANIGGICVYEMTIQQRAKVGLGCFMEDQVADFKNRYDKMHSTLPPFMLQPKIRDNADIIQYGEVTTVDGVSNRQGSQNDIYFKDFYNKTGAFRGHSLDFLLFEEAGENPLLKSSYLVSEECWKEGAVYFGTPIIFGTSNQINNGLSDLEEMYYNNEEYNLLKYFIPASKAYYPFIDLKKGVSDVEGATEDIMKKRAIKKSLEDKVAYYTFLQEMPLKEADCFMLGASSIFDLNKIHTQMDYIADNKHVRGMVQRGYLDWIKNPDGEVIREVEWTPDPHGPMYQLYPPLKNDAGEVNELRCDVGGVDSYAKDESETSDSKGSVHIYRAVANMDIADELPVFEYCDRPPTKQDFYENCAKIAIYYNCKLLIEDTDEDIFKFFVENGLTKYLKEAPVIYKTIYTKASNRYGYTIQGAGKKAKLVDTVHDYVKTRCNRIFYMELLKEMTIFGIKNTDRVMSFGLALIHAKDNAHLKIRTIRKPVKKIGYPGLKHLQKTKKYDPFGGV